MPCLFVVQKKTKRRKKEILYFFLLFVYFFSFPHFCQPSSLFSAGNSVPVIFFFPSFFTISHGLFFSLYFPVCTESENSKSSIMKTKGRKKRKKQKKRKRKNKVKRKKEKKEGKRKNGKKIYEKENGKTDDCCSNSRCNDVLACRI